MIDSEDPQTRANSTELKERFIDMGPDTAAPRKATRSRLVTSVTVVVALIAVASVSVNVIVFGTMYARTGTIMPSNGDLVNAGVLAVTNGEIPLSDILASLDSDLISTILLQASGSRFNLLVGNWVASDTLHKFLARDLSTYTKKGSELLQKAIDSGMFMTSRGLNDAGDVVMVVKGVFDVVTEMFAIHKDLDESPVEADATVTWPFIDGVMDLALNQLNSTAYYDLADACVQVGGSMGAMKYEFTFKDRRGNPNPVSVTDDVHRIVADVTAACAKFANSRPKGKAPVPVDGLSIVPTAVATWLKFDFGLLLEALLPLSARVQERFAAQFGPDSKADARKISYNIHHVIDVMRQEWATNGMASRTGALAPTTEAQLVAVPIVGSPLGFLLHQGDVARWKAAAEACLKLAGRVSMMSWKGSYTHKDLSGQTWDRSWNGERGVNRIVGYVKEYCQAVAMM